ncbi:hypothetical protein MKZ38_000900 [Zalerion maritima]|uniref:FAD dependent oxidoreductase domain-containing protein n=1 Tax=Zalerion maritima TaxID=339359 RepID=A0AAD5RXX6_9PEZI|nr:hypothetical protein MKZ38_000900 [Zalerion maritima]
MDPPTPEPKPKHIVIIGGGIIGCSTAYFLTRHPSYDKTHHRVTILEAASVAAGASGKAGGLLAKWAYPDSLVALSYRLHTELAAEYGGDQRWGYRKIGCGSIEAAGRDPVQLKLTADEMKAASESLAKQPQISPALGTQTTEARFAPISISDPGTPLGNTRGNEVRLYSSPTSPKLGQSGSVPQSSKKLGCIVVQPPSTPPASKLGPAFKERKASCTENKPLGCIVVKPTTPVFQKKRKTKSYDSDMGNGPETPQTSAKASSECVVVQPPSWFTDEDMKVQPVFELEDEEVSRVVLVNDHADGQIPRSQSPPPIDKNILRHLKKLTAPQTPKEWEKLPKQDVTAASLLMPVSPLPKDLDWFDGRCVHSWAEMGVPGTTTETAQVHPLHFTTAMAQLAREGGVNIIEGAQVVDLVTDPKLGLQSIVYKQRNLGAQGDDVGGAESSGLKAEPKAIHIDDATETVVCAGPWTGKLLPKSGISGPRAHSVVYDVDVSPYAVFSEIKLPYEFVPDHRRKNGQERMHKDVVDPEVYARPFSEVYACGETDRSIPLPETADLVQVDVEACDDITAYLSTVSPTLGSAPIKAKQACYLPVHTRFGEERGPLIGKTGTPGLYMASGHTCWGIQNGPGTGKLMSELLMEGRTKSAKIDKFDPRKFKVSAGVNTRTAGREE